MSAIGTKRTSPSCAAHVRFWGKADMLWTRNENQTGGDASVDCGGMIKIKYR